MAELKNFTKTTLAPVLMKTGSREEYCITTASRKEEKVSLSIKSGYRFEDIVDVVGDLVSSFLTLENIASLVSSSVMISRCYFIPLDLYNIKLSLEDFKLYFGNRPTFNVIGLNIQFTNPSDDITVLTPFLPRLRTLTLSSRLKTYHNLQCLSLCKELTRLKLDLPMVGLEFLPQCSKLNNLDIWNSTLTEQGLEPLAECSNLSNLTLYKLDQSIRYNNHESKNVYDVLGKLKNLKEIILDGLPRLTKLPSMTKCSLLRNINITACPNLVDISGLKNCISLDSWHIDSSPFLEDFEPLASCTKLKSVYICRDHSEDNRDVEIKTNLFCEALDLDELIISNYMLEDNSSFQYWRSLKILALGCGVRIPRLPDIGLPNHKGVLSGLETFKLYDLDISELKVLPSSEGLKKISIKDCQLLTNANFITNCKNLTHLEIHYCPIISFDFLAHCLNLVKLTLTYANAVDLNVLEGHKKITHLNLYGTEVVSLDGLHGCSSLKHLDIRQTLISNLDILEYFPLLEVLLLDHCNNIEDFSPLTVCTQLTYLSLSGTKIKSLLPLEHMNKLKTLDLSNCKNIHLQSLTKCASLEELYLENYSPVYLSELLLLESVRKISLIRTPINDSESNIACMTVNLNVKIIIISPTEAYINKNGKLIKKKGIY